MTDRIDMKPALERETLEPRDFSLGTSPFRKLLRLVHMTRANGTPRVGLIVLCAWLPLCVAAVVRYAVDGRVPHILLDISVHVRLLVVIPLLFLAEKLHDERCRSAVTQLYKGQFTARADVDRIISAAERARDSVIAELVILVCAVAMCQATLWGFLGPTGVFAGVTDPGSLSFAQIWYVTVSLPVTQFVALRWLWHWGIWSYVVVRVSRLPLRTIATHPDRAAGIGFLASPVSAFAGFVLASSAMLAGVWGTRIVNSGASINDFIPTFVTFVVIVMVVAFGPLLLYIGILYRARHREIRAYNGLALDYVRRFHHKWLIEAPHEEHLLGSSDIQSLNDLLGAFRSLVDVRLVPFGTRSAIAIWVAAVIPMLPLVATVVPLDKLLADVGRALLGGLPG